MPDGRAPACEDRWAIEQLVHQYAWHIDEGDFEAMASLFAHGEWFGCHGRDEVLEWMTRNVLLYDGSPCTHHVVSNLQVTLGADQRSAEARSYITVHHQVPGDREIKVISANVYFDEFEKADAGWRFTRRAIRRRLVGEAERHRRA